MRAQVSVLLTTAASSALPAGTAGRQGEAAPPTAAPTATAAGSSAATLALSVAATVAAGDPAKAPTAAPTAAPTVAVSDFADSPATQQPASASTADDTTNTAASAATQADPFPVPVPVPFPGPVPVPAPVPFPGGHGNGNGHDHGSTEDYDWHDEAVAEAMVDVLHVLLPKPLWALLVEEEYDDDDEEEYRDNGDKVPSPGGGGSSSSSSSSEEDSGEDYSFDWGSMGSMLGRRRRAVAQRVDDADDDGGDHQGGDDERAWLALARKAVRQQGRAPARTRGDRGDNRQRFAHTLRRAFYRARSRVLARGRAGTVTATPDAHAAQAARAELLTMASRALAVSREEVARAFGDMATRWVGEALFELLFEDDDDDDDFGDADIDLEDEPWNVNWDAGVKLNGSFNLAGNAASASPAPSATSRPAELSVKQHPPPRRHQAARVGVRGGRGGDLDLSPSSIAYFLVELMGTAAGLGWGALFFGTHAAGAVG